MSVECFFYFLFSKRTRKKAFGGWGIKCIHMGERTFPTRPTAHFTSASSRLRDASGALDDMSLRKIAVAKRLGKVFCMGIWVCLFEGVHLTSSLSRSDGGDSGGLLKAVSQTFLLSWCCCCTDLGSTRIKLNKLICWLFDFTPYVSMQCPHYWLILLKQHTCWWCFYFPFAIEDLRNVYNLDLETTYVHKER